MNLTKLTLKNQPWCSDAVDERAGKSIPYILVNERHIISTKLNWLRRNMLIIVVAILVTVDVMVLLKHTDTVSELQNANAQVTKERDAHKTTSNRFSELQEQKTIVDSSLREERLKTAEKAKEIESLKVNLQAKREAQAAAITAAQTKQLTQKKQASAVSVTGTCASWLAQAGVTDLASANELIRRESNCNPNAVNKSSGACGVAQELPCGKSGCSLGDGACQVAWMNRYVLGRYGSWANAVAFHNKNNWY